MPKLINQVFLDRKKWRNWLEDNHSSKKEVWLIIHKKQSEKKGLRYQKAVEKAICFGWIDSKMQRIDKERFRPRFSTRRQNSIWSKNNKETAKRLIQE